MSQDRLEKNLSVKLCSQPNRRLLKKRRKRRKQRFSIRRDSCPEMLVGAEYSPTTDLIS